MPGHNRNSVAPPGYLGPDALEPRVLLDGDDDTKADVVGAGHPPDALRPLRVELQPGLLRVTARSAAALLRRINPAAAARHVWISVLGQHVERQERDFVPGQRAVE